ncbi:bacteriorhodopsin [Sporosarcina luteola]|nr:bacteriorhodopsin [Sporosarcina luteola]
MDIQHWIWVLLTLIAVIAVNFGIYKVLNKNVKNATVMKISTAFTLVCFVFFVIWSTYPWW